MDCKEALTECDGDENKAFDFLRTKGLATAAKRAGRAMSEGVVQSYIHSDSKLGVMVEINCETDFVAKNDDFKDFAKNIAMHIAATNPVGNPSRRRSSRNHRERKRNLPQPSYGNGQTGKYCR